MLAIYKRELKSYFHSMTGCVFIAFLVMFTGIYFMAYNLNAGYPYFSYTLSGSLIVFLVGIPLLTMRSFSEERKTKTDQLLLTAPVSLTKVVLGKYFAMVTVLAVPNVIFCLFPLLIKLQGTAYLLVDYTAPVSLTKVVLGKYFAMVTVLAVPNVIFCLFPLLIKLQGTAYLLVDYSSIAVFFLLGCVYLAIGMFMSSLTESQIIAFISTFGILLLLYLWDGILSFLPSSALSGMIGILLILTLIVVYIYHMTKNWMLAAGIEAVGIVTALIVYFVKSSLYENLLTKLLGRLALADVFMNISSSNIVDVSGLLLYVSILIIFVFLTIQTIQKRRWS